MINSRKLLKLLTVVITVIISLSLILTLSACNDGNSLPKDPEVKDKVIEEMFPNGSFYQTSGTKSPYTATNWTGAAGYSSGDNATPSSVPKDLVYGVISAHPKAYQENMSIWDKAPNPGIPAGAVDGDGNMLMIYNKIPTAYKFTNNKLSLEMGNYYKVSVDVKTVGLSGDPAHGAYIYFSDAAIAKFEKINTQGEWATYEFYIESSTVSAKSLTVTLALGYGSKTDGKLTKGYAFFDNVKASLVTLDDYTAASVDTNEKTATDSMRFLNGDFTFHTGSGVPYSATNYSTLTGSGKDAADSANTTGSYTKRGIVDIIKDKENKYFTDNKTIKLPEGVFDAAIDESLALMIHNTDYSKGGTAAGYSSSKFYVPMGKVAKISVWLWTDILNDGLDTGDNKHGAYMIFSGDSEPFESEPLLSQGKWTQYQFYIDATKSSSSFVYSLEMWLGLGGQQALDYHAYGTAFFDNISLEYIDAVPGDVADREHRVLSCPTTSNSLGNGDFKDNNLDGWYKAPVEDVSVAEGDADAEIKTFDQVVGTDFEPQTQGSNVLIMSNKVKSAYRLTTEFPKDTIDPSTINKINIEPHKYYKLSFWVKTKDIEKNKGASIEIFSKDKEDNRVSFYTYSNINTLNYNNYSTKGFREYVVYIEGHEIDSKELFLEIKLGTGTNVDPTNFLAGQLCLSGVRFSPINYNEYNNSTTSSYVNKKSLSGTSNEITNGNFNKFDMKLTKFDDKGNLTEAAVPTGFIKVGGNFTDYNSGTLSAENIELCTKYNITGSNVYNGWVTPPPSGHIATGGSPYFLFLQNKERTEEVSAEKPQKAVGYKTESFSLSSSTYYLITVDVKTVKGYASLYFSTTSGTNEIAFENISTGGKWEQYTFAIEVGLTSTSVELAMYLGKTRDTVDKEPTETNTCGEVYFDNLLYTSYTTLADYDDAKKKYYNDNVPVKGFSEQSFVTETFDRTSSGSPLDKPYTSNWTGNVGGAAEGGKAPNGTDFQTMGIISKDTDYADVKTGILPEYDGSTIPPVEPGTDLAGKSADIWNVGANTDLILGNKILMINNKKPSAYNYQTYSSKSFAGGKAYAISVWVKTYLITGPGASIVLKVDSNTHTFTNIGKGVDAMSEWTKYNFYVYNEKDTSISSVYVTLQLGSYSNVNKEGDYVSGYAFFDNMTFKEMNKDDFIANDTRIKTAIGYNPDKPTKVKTDTEWAIKYTKDKASDDTNTDGPDDPVTPTPPKAQFPWLLVSSLIIGAFLIVAVIAVLIRYFKKKPRVNAGKADYDRKKKVIGGSDDKESKKDEYDQYSDKE